ncbi:MAG: exosortase/archaeosortase family protein [Victivallaceae bacterium]|jgi:exosortase
MFYMRKITRCFRSYPIAVIAFACAWIVAGFRAYQLTAGSWERPLPLLLLVLVMTWHIWAEHHEPKKSGMLKILPWTMLLGAPIVFLLPLPSVDTVLFIQFWAILIFTLGLRSGGMMGVPIFLCFLVIPYQEQIALFISYPLRLISTVLSVKSLQIFGVDVNYEFTTVTIGEAAIAITDACSGITQLEVLLLLGYLVVLRQHQSGLMRSLHYCCMLPVIIITNSLRLILTIILFMFIGNSAFDDFWHKTLGYFLIVGVMLLFWWIGTLFPENGAGNEDRD